MALRDAADDRILMRRLDEAALMRRSGIDGRVLTACDHSRQNGVPREGDFPLWPNTAAVERQPWPPYLGGAIRSCSSCSEIGPSATAANADSSTAPRPRFIEELTSDLRK